MKKRIRLLQRLLQQSGWYNGKIDGIIGPKTLNGLSKIEGLNISWSEDRIIIGALQLLAISHGIPAGPVDGYWGPVTQHAFDELTFLLDHGHPSPLWRPEDRIPSNPNGWPVQYTGDFTDFYGKRGKNLVRVHSPYPMKIAWNTSQKINSFSCHKKVKDSLERILNNVLFHYGREEIQRLRLDLFGGCFNERLIRGGTKWSMHSWGIAVDFDPARNRLKWGRDRAAFAHSDYEKWWQCWEQEGWISLGRTRNFDWMHIQAALIQ